MGKIQTAIGLLVENVDGFPDERVNRPLDLGPPRPIRIEIRSENDLHPGAGIPRRRYQEAPQ